MDIKMIASSMFFIIVALLIWVKYYYPKEQLKNQAETEYAKAVLDFIKTSNNETSDQIKISQIINKAKNLAKLQKLNKNQLIKLVENDLKMKLDKNAFL